MPIGQQLDDTSKRYYRHPNTGVLIDGSPLDAGTAHFIHSNLSCLSEQNRKLIGHAIGPGAVGEDALNYAQFYGVIDQPVPTAAELGIDPTLAIPWLSGKFCINMGPFPIPRNDPAQNNFNLKVVVECAKGSAASTNLIIAARQMREETPLLGSNRYFQVNDTGAGVYMADLNVPISFESRGTRIISPWNSRASSLDQTTMISSCYIQVGWMSNDTAQGDYVYSISVYEEVE